MNEMPPIMKYLNNIAQGYNMPPQTPQAEPQRQSAANGCGVYEIAAKTDIEYIEPDKSGRQQIFICRNENKIYTRRYNHSRQDYDYRSYVDEGDVEIFKKNDTNEVMIKISEALMLVANKLDTVEKKQDEINDELKELRPKPPVKKEPRKVKKVVYEDMEDEDTEE